MSIYGDILGLQSKEQQIAQQVATREATQVATQDKLLDLLMNRRALANAEGYQAELRAGAAAPPTAPTPAAPASIGATRDADTDPNTRMLNQLRRDREFIQTNMLLAQKYGQKVDHWVTALDKVNNDMRQVSADITKRQSDDTKETAQIIAGIDSPATADAALRHIADRFGPKPALDLYKKLQVNPDGSVLWNDANKAIFGQYENQFTSMHERATQKNNAVTAAQRAARDEETARHNLRTEQQRDQTAVIARENIAAANTRNAARIKASRERLDTYLEATGMKIEGQRVKEDQTRIDKLATQYNIPQINAAVEVAERVESKLLDPKQGYAAVSTPEARSVVEQYKQMVNNFRARASSVEQEREVARMNGVLQKAGKYLSTWGEGDKLVEKNVMLDLVREMKTIAADRNADLLRDELNIAQNTNKRGGNASWLSLRGDLDRAIATGRAKKVTVDGKEYAVITKPGKKPTAADMFELPTAPVGRANRFLAPPAEATVEE